MKAEEDFKNIKNEINNLKSEKHLTDLGKEYLLELTKALEDRLLLLNALQELIQVKEGKDEYGKCEKYMIAQPKAWENAKEAVKLATQKELTLTNEK